MKQYPLVQVCAGGEVIHRFWPKGLNHARVVINWFNGVVEPRGQFGATVGKVAKMTTVEQCPTPWQVWEDNCRFEHLCVRYRGIGMQKILRITQPGIHKYHGNPLTYNEFNDPPVEEDSLLSLMG